MAKAKALKEADEKAEAEARALGTCRTCRDTKYTYYLYEVHTTYLLFLKTLVESEKSKICATTIHIQLFFIYFPQKLFLGGNY